VEEIKLRLLVVDDERPIRKFLCASLSGTYTVLEAASGEEALAAKIPVRFSERNLYSPGSRLGGRSPGRSRV